MKRRTAFLTTVFCFGLAFLYVPIFSMIVFSFNKSRLATVWGGFSTEWYSRLWRNDQIIDAAALSLQIALVSATFATILGTLAGLALARFHKFRGRMLMSAMVTAPLVMPEVITGISMLMLFIMLAEWTGWPGERGFTTITLAHITFSMAYVATIVHSRLSQAEVAIEEAALDLGARPWQVLRDITLPIIAPALVTGWLLAFTISIDDVVITSFTSGPGSTTLPILIWSKVRLGVTPDINALATIIVVTVGIVVATASVIMNHVEARRELDTQLAQRGS
ncbi:MAG: ABC transporter permease subunit [Hyphomicrobium sp.]